MRALGLYRDDGPLARALGTALGLPPPGPVALLVAGVVPLAVVLIVADRPNAAVGLTIAWVVVLGAASSRRPLRGRLDWLVPVELRLVEYGTIAALASHAGGDAWPSAYALLAAVALHHYDIIYRLRHQRAAPSPIVGSLGGGWELRMLVAYLLARADALAVGLAVAAGWTAVLFVAESAASWMRTSALDPGDEMSIEAGGD